LVHLISFGKWHPNFTPHLQKEKDKENTKDSGTDLRCSHEKQL